VSHRATFPHFFQKEKRVKGVCHQLPVKEFSQKSPSDFCYLTAKKKPKPKHIGFWPNAAYFEADDILFF